MKRKASGGEGGNTSYWPKKGKKEKKASDGEPKKEKKSTRKREGDDVQSDASAAVGIAKKKKSTSSKSSGKKPTSKDEHFEGGAGAGAAKPDGEYVNKVPQNHKEQKELAVKRKKERNPHFDMVQEVRGRAQNNTTCLHVRTRTHTHTHLPLAPTHSLSCNACVLLVAARTFCMSLRDYPLCVCQPWLYREASSIGNALHSN